MRSGTSCRSDLSVLRTDALTSRAVRLRWWCPASGNAPPVTVTFSESDNKNGAFIWGWALGGGVEVMVAPKVFMRAEYEFAAFQPVFNIKSQIQTGRLGLGYKF